MKCYNDDDDKWPIFCTFWCSENSHGVSVSCLMSEKITTPHKLRREMHCWQLLMDNTISTNHNRSILNQKLDHQIKFQSFNWNEISSVSVSNARQIRFLKKLLIKPRQLGLAVATHFENRPQRALLLYLHSALSKNWVNLDLSRGSSRRV